MYESCSDISNPKTSPVESKKNNFSTSSSKKGTSLGKFSKQSIIFQILFYSELSDDSEEVFEKDEYQDYDQAVTHYLDELQAQSPKQKTFAIEPWISEPLKSSSSMEFDDFRNYRRLSVLPEVNEEAETSSVNKKVPCFS